MTRKHKPALALVLALAACGGGETKVEDPKPDDATGAFDALEQRLLNSSYVELTGRISSTGAIASALEGSLIIDGDRVLLGFQGSFAGQDVTVSLSSDGAKMSGGSGTLSFELDTPSALKQGLLVGVTRMGLLHNLAVLASGNPPQGTYGDVETWVTVSDVTAGDHTLGFGVVVAGKPSATAKLTLDTETGLPARREQTVRLRDGDMLVVEDYEQFTVR